MRCQNFCNLDCEMCDDKTEVSLPPHGLWKQYTGSPRSHKLSPRLPALRYHLCTLCSCLLWITIKSFGLHFLFPTFSLHRLCKSPIQYPLLSFPHILNLPTQVLWNSQCITFKIPSILKLNYKCSFHVTQRTSGSSLRIVLSQWLIGLSPSFLIPWGLELG